MPEAPEGVDPERAEGAVPLQIVCTPLIVLLAIADTIVIFIAALVLAGQSPADTDLLYQVSVLKAPGI